jgi:hypothetical protein
VTVTAPPGITITPASQPLNRNEPDILRFDITVTEGAVGQVAIGARVFDAGGDVGSPDVVVDGDGWTFAEESEG